MPRFCMMALLMLFSPDGPSTRNRQLPSKPAGMVSGCCTGSGHPASKPSLLRSSSVAASCEHRRAKTDRLDTELLKHCP